jgi:hypothetical protein
MIRFLPDVLIRGKIVTKFFGALLPMNSFDQFKMRLICMIFRQSRISQCNSMINLGLLSRMPLVNLASMGKTDLLLQGASDMNHPASHTLPLDRKT